MKSKKMAYMFLQKSQWFPRVPVAETDSKLKDFSSVPFMRTCK
jgi:hypothetical protein